uniref:Uncharacterized protein n=1 Tax=Rhizophora mucronata TaxID=61149 RepID=A0A2P2PQE0_RHIMU
MLRLPGRDDVSRSLNFIVQ